MPRPSIFDARKAQEASAGGRHQVFVYGTLKHEGPNHAILGSNRILNGYTRAPGYVMVHLGGFPGAVKVKSGGWHVYGEVWDIDDKAFEMVDHLEGYPEFYHRDIIDLDIHGKAWIYALPADRYLKKGTKFIAHGRWAGQNTSSHAWDPNMEEALNGYIGISLKPALSSLPALPSQPLALPGSEPRPRPTGPVVGPGWEEA